jgi:secernin
MADHPTAPVLVAGCDTLVALGEAALRGRVLFAKNSDRPPGECQPLALVPRLAHAPGSEVRCQYIAIPQVRETALVLGSRPVWLWGFEHGLNEHGVAIGNETVFAREAPEAIGLLGMDLVRLALERATTALEAVGVVTSLIETHGQGGSGFRDSEWPYNNGFLIADPREAWIVEAAGRHWAARRARATDSISNQVSIGGDWEKLSAGAIDRAASAGWDGGSPFDFANAFRDREGVPAVFSEGRLRRSQALLAAASGALTPARMREALRDHHGGGRTFRSGASPDQEAFYTLCMHEGPSRTAASLVAELEPEPHAGVRSAWASFGRPCASVFFPVVLAAELPASLTRGSDGPSDALWWVFEELAAAAERDPDAAARIAETFAVLEADLDLRLEQARPGLAADATAAEFMREVAGLVERSARGLGSSLGG